MIYLDYAATSGRKPEAVYEASDRVMREVSGNPGRSGHKISLEAGAIVAEARLLCSRLFHAPASETIAFGVNTTEALNLGILGMVGKGDHVITSSLEHNSVARPLEHLKDEGVEVTKIRADLENGVDPDAVEAAIKDNTKLVVMTHISNVTGTVNDIAAIGDVCRRHGVTFLVDAAQSAGVRPIDVQAMKIDMLAFPGHKCLYGPQGTGGLYISPEVDLRPLLTGGTGTQSELLHQPVSRPERYESGTLNVPGLAGLAKGVDFILKTGVDAIEEKEYELTARLISGIRQYDNITIWGPQTAKNRAAVLSITIDGYEPQDISIYLDQIFDIAVRSGLHCAPYAHETLGTLDKGGTVRISPGYFTTEEEIDACIEAIGIISRGEV
ncbi:MAG: aminotransferase class V-fold PLP-dependent enzyme [Lachnospiraceae bacterium]|nr:aminotransferase class V-fold PLP-dependent enzyme [Lachnospiraceae bacterium]